MARQYGNYRVQWLGSREAGKYGMHGVQKQRSITAREYSDKEVCWLRNILATEYVGLGEFISHITLINPTLPSK